MARPAFNRSKTLSQHPARLALAALTALCAASVGAACSSKSPANNEGSGTNASSGSSSTTGSSTGATGTGSGSVASGSSGSVGSGSVVSGSSGSAAAGSSGSVASGSSGSAAAGEAEEAGEDAGTTTTEEAGEDAGEDAGTTMIEEVAPPTPQTCTAPMLASIMWTGTCSAGCMTGNGCPTGGAPGAATTCLIAAANPAAASGLDGIPDNQLLPQYAVDGDPTTRFSSGTPQIGCEYFAFDMCRMVSINGINLLTGQAGTADITDVPTSYTVQVSTDGNTWTQVAMSATAPDPDAMITFTATTARYVLLTQTGVSVGAYWWSIHEVSPTCP
jgi:hypothetical protein